MPKPKPSDAGEERLKIPLDPEEALRALLQVDPESDPLTERAAKPDQDQRPPRRSDRRNT